MNGDGLTPERLDAILDGRDPATDDEARDMLALAGALREAVPGATDDLRARVRALPQPAPGGRLRRLLNSGWRGRTLIAAPALTAVIAAVVAVGVLTRSESQDVAQSGAAHESLTAAQRTSGTTPENAIAGSAPATSLAPAAPKAATGAADATVTEPIVIRVARSTLVASAARVRTLVGDAGGSVVEEPAPPGQTTPVQLVSISVPSERSADVFAAIAALDTATAPAASRFAGPAATSDGVSRVRILLTEAP